MPIWHQSPKLTPRYFLETPRLFGYPTIFGFMKYVSATDILSDFKKTVDSYFVNSLKEVNLI